MKLSPRERLNTIGGADEILVMSDESGTHDDLMRSGGIYRDFVTIRENSRGWSRRIKTSSCSHSSTAESRV